jgi:hypothetical protein
MAGVTAIKGRLYYGLRRHNVDAVLADDISLPGLGKSGGWSDATTPTKIYAEQESSRARKEASEARARVRKEPDTPPTVTEP